MQEACETILEIAEEGRRDRMQLLRAELEEQVARQVCEDIGASLRQCRDVHDAASQHLQESLQLERQFADWLRAAHQFMREKVAQIDAETAQGRLTDRARMLVLSRAAVEQLRTQRLQVQQALGRTRQKITARQDATGLLGLHLVLQLSEFDFEETLGQVAAAADFSAEEARAPLREFVDQAVAEEPLQTRLRAPHGRFGQAMLEGALAASFFAACELEWREAVPPPRAPALAGNRCALKCCAAAEENRCDVEAREWSRWRPRLLQLLSEADAPSQGERWTVVHFIDYVRARASEPCGPTVLIQVQQVVEITEMLLGAGRSPTMRAARFASAFIVVLEQLVADEGLAKYLRGGLAATLARAKIGGAGRKMLELPLVASRERCMRGLSWIETGFRLWQEIADFERDRFLPRPDGGGRDVPGKAGGNAEAAAADALRGMLAPALAGMIVEPLLPEEQFAVVLRSGRAFVELDEAAAVPDLANWLVLRKTLTDCEATDVAAKTYGGFRRDGVAEEPVAELDRDGGDWGNIQFGGGAQQPPHESAGLEETGKYLIACTKTSNAARFHARGWRLLPAGRRWARSIPTRSRMVEYDMVAVAASESGGEGSDTRGVDEQEAAARFRATLRGGGHARAQAGEALRKAPAEAEPHATLRDGGRALALAGELAAAWPEARPGHAFHQSISRAPCPRPNRLGRFRGLTADPPLPRGRPQFGANGERRGPLPPPSQRARIAGAWEGPRSVQDRGRRGFAANLAWSRSLNPRAVQAAGSGAPGKGPRAAQEGPPMDSGPPGKFEIYTDGRNAEAPPRKWAAPSPSSAAAE
ncbi:unnamed protein product [Prorocentrum cordatum]|uniref:Uncharacterized protein n=1 Tax=Prorocentrum cordatum TaxID=2364126 RepID=A0ABN9XNK0_9DINO|nr:unnamed protein product [Polarella glacialis]